MNFPVTHPIWMWLYFGTFGTLATVLFALVVWTWLKYHALARGHLRSATKWSMVGFMFLFFGAWFACGIGGPPGNMLSSDPTAHNLLAATGAAMLSMFFSVPGWACVLVGQRKMMQVVLAGQEDRAGGLESSAITQA